MDTTVQLSDRIRAFLDEPRFGVLATIGEDGLPHQTVVWYEVRDGYILMNTARGRLKDRHLRRDPRASLCVEDGYRYVTIAGSVERDDDQTTAQADIARLAHRYQTRAAAERNIQRFRQQRRITLRLRIARVIAEGFES